MTKSPAYRRTIGDRAAIRTLSGMTHFAECFRWTRPRGRLATLVIGSLLASAAIAAPAPQLGAMEPQRPSGGAAASAAEATAARQEDLDFLVKEIAARHPNAFALRSREAFTADADALRARLAELDDVQFMIELSRLVATLGDGHTSVDKVLGSYPLQVAFFSDGPRPIVLPKANESALGGKIVAIGGQPIDEVMRRLATIDACETETTLRARARVLIIAPEVLYGLGLAEPRTATFTVEREDGSQEEVELVALTKESKLEWAVRHPGGELLRMRDSRRGAVLMPIEDGRSLYLAYRRCTIDPEAPLGDLMKSLLESIDRDSPQRVVIDLRGNGGGNSALLLEWLPELAKRSKSRERGWLAVLIDRHTFSSAIMNAWQLREQCNAVLYGEPTGGAKNHFGEMRSFKLPRSGLTVHHSTKYFKLDNEGPGPVVPDVRVAERYEDYAAGRDPTLEAALAPGSRVTPPTK